jgi:hypothetical protein
MLWESDENSVGGFMKCFAPPQQFETFISRRKIFTVASFAIHTLKSCAARALNEFSALSTAPTTTALYPSNKKG